MNEQWAQERSASEKAESSLRLMKFAVDHASDSLFWIRPDAGFSNVNDSTCRRLGYSREELLGMTVFDVDPAFPREVWVSHWQEIKKRKSFTIETKHRTKTGEVFPVEVTLNYVEYEGAEYNFAFARDISERKRAEETLHKANQDLERAVADRTAELETTLERLKRELENRKQIEMRLQVTQFSVDNAADAVFWVRPDGTYAYANRSASSMLGYSNDEFLRLKTFDLNPEHRGEAWRNHWEELRRQGSLRFESSLISKDGSPLPVEISANHVEFEGLEYNCAFVRNITERKQAEELLRVSEKRYRFLFETMAQGVVQQSSDGHIIDANKAAEDILGLSKSQMQGRTSTDPRWRSVREDESPFPGEEHPAIVALRTAQPIRNVTMGVFHPTEERYHWLLVSATPQFRPGEDIPYQVFATFTDITERKLVEKKLAHEAALNSVLSELTENILMAESIEDMAVETLKKAQQVTESRFGYVGYIDTITGFLVCPTMTHDIWDHCGVPGKSIVFEKHAGLWGWVLSNKKPLMTNNLAADSRSTGVPRGHLPITRFLSVPAFHGDVLVGQIALANSGRDYHEEDLAIVERIATIFALGMRRKRAEEELHKMNDELEQRVTQRTADIENKKVELEKMNRLFVGRELRMKELKDRIRALEIATTGGQTHENDT